MPPRLEMPSLKGFFSKEVQSWQTFTETRGPPVAAMSAAAERTTFIAFGPIAEVANSAGMNHLANGGDLAKCRLPV